MNILTNKTLGVINYFHDKIILIHEIVCVSPPSYYPDWIEIFVLIFLNIGLIQHIYIMSSIGIFYADWHLRNQTVAPTLPGI